MAVEFLVDDMPESLALLERIIVSAKTTNPAVFVVGAGDLQTLKTLCSEIRARSPAAANKALEAVGFQVNSAMRAKARLGYLEDGYAQALTDRVLAHWLVIRLGLENLKQGNCTDDVRDSERSTG